MRDKTEMQTTIVYLLTAIIYMLIVLVDIRKLYGNNAKN